MLDISSRFKLWSVKPIFVYKSFWIISVTFPGTSLSAGMPFCQEGIQDYVPSSECGALVGLQCWHTISSCIFFFYILTRHTSLSSTVKAYLLFPVLSVSTETFPQQQSSSEAHALCMCSQNYSACHVCCFTSGSEFHLLSHCSVRCDFTTLLPALVGFPCEWSHLQMLSSN